MNYHHDDDLSDLTRTTDLHSELDAIRERFSELAPPAHTDSQTYQGVVSSLQRNLDALLDLLLSGGPGEPQYQSSVRELIGKTSAAANNDMMKLERLYSREAQPEIRELAENVYRVVDTFQRDYGASHPD